MDYQTHIQVLHCIIHKQKTNKSGTNETRLNKSNYIKWVIPESSLKQTGYSNCRLNNSCWDNRF